MTVAYSSWAETESFMEGYVLGYKKGCLRGYEMCLKMIDDADTPEELRAMLRLRIARLCQEIEDEKK